MPIDLYESKWDRNIPRYLLSLKTKFDVETTLLEHIWIDPEQSRFARLLADVDISPNPDPFNFWTSESEYIKKTGIRIHLCQNLVMHGQNPHESIYGLESEYISFFAIEYEYNYP